MAEQRSPLVLANARLVGATSDVVDLVVADGRVQSIVPAGRAVRTERVDLGGRFVQAGLWDHHVHFDQWAMKRSRLDVSSADSAREVADLVAERLRTDPPANGRTLVGFGFRDALWPDEPHRDLLDSVAPAVPVALISQDLHCAWLNSLALARCGHSADASGLLRESDADTAMAVLHVDPDVVDELADDAARQAAARGVVGIVEFEDARNPDVWVRRVRNGGGHFRVECAVYSRNLDWVIGGGLRTGDVLPDTTGLVTMGPLKIITDGSLNTRTAYCREPYPDLAGAPDDRGMLLVPPDVLVPLMRRAHEHGIACAVHAIGDHANSLVLDAFAEVGCCGSVEHAQLLDRADFRRFRRLGVVASVQPAHAVLDREVADRHWAGRTDRSFAYADLLGAGAIVRFGSDAPVAPLDPWVTIRAAVERTLDERPAWHAEQSVPIAAALESSTRGRYQVREGVDADLVVLDRDPLATGVADLDSMPVHATMTGGRWTWSR